MAQAEKERIKRWQSHDFYAVLCITPSATAAEVKKGFRKVALTCHPDKVPQEERERATRQFQLIAEAYEVLSDRSMRQKYDSVRPRGTTASTPKFRDQHQPNYNAGYAKQQSTAPTPGWQSSAPNDDWRRPQKSAQDGVYHRCAGCDNRHLLKDLRKCHQCDNPKAAGLLCRNCDMCAGCVPDDIPRARRPAPAPRQNPKPEPAAREHAEQRTNWRSKPLYEDLTEFWERVDRPSVDSDDDEPKQSSDNNSNRAQANRSDRSAHVPTNNNSNRAQANRGDPSVAHRNPQERNIPRQQPQPQSREQPDNARRPHGNSDREYSNYRMACHGNEDQDLAEPLDKLDILMAMGFAEEQCREALERCSSVESAVEFIMNRNDPGMMTRYIRPAANALHRVVEPATPYVQPAANAVYGAMQPVGKGLYKVGEHVGKSETGNVVHQAVQPAAQGIYGMVERVGNDLYGAMRGGSGNAEIATTLISLGFSEQQAKAASLRCSSVEAAVDWISARPELAA